MAAAALRNQGASGAPTGSVSKTREKRTGGKDSTSKAAARAILMRGSIFEPSKRRVRGRSELPKAHSKSARRRSISTPTERAKRKAPTFSTRTRIPAAPNSWIAILEIAAARASTR